MLRRFWSHCLRIFSIRFLCRSEHKTKSVHKSDSKTYVQCAGPLNVCVSPFGIVFNEGLQKYFRE